MQVQDCIFIAQYMGLETELLLVNAQLANRPAALLHPDATSATSAQFLGEAEPLAELLDQVIFWALPELSVTSADPAVLPVALWRAWQACSL